MSNRFRPHLNLLEAREVPASLSAQLADGSVVSALFSTPDGVDPTLGSQVLAVTDLAVTKGGFQYTTQPGAHANYANGVLVGVVATAVGPGAPIQLNVNTVQVGGYVAPVAYDAADTEVTFTLPDGTVGAISFDVPWDQVDEAEASQSISPMGFNLNIAGQNFAYGSSSFTTAPALMFEYGEFKGVTFALDTSTTAGFAYTAFTGSFNINGDNIITAIDAVTSLPITAPADTKGSPTGFINFAPLGTQANAYTLNVKFTASDGSKFEQSYNVGANNSAADVAGLVMESIPKASITPANGGNPPTYVAGWYVKMNAAGTGFYVYTHRAETEQKWGSPKPVSAYKSAEVSAVGATAQPTVIETQSGPK